MLNQVRLALGIDTPESAQWFWYMLVDQEAAIENIGLIVSQVIQNQLKGESSVDMLMKTAPKTFGGLIAAIARLPFNNLPLQASPKHGFLHPCPARPGG